ncbi:gamma-tubulin complex component 5 isoform X2 [Argonauta hians]
MARRKESYERLCRELIKQVSDIKDESSDEFKQCYTYSMSNFKYHRFLSVDSHKVKESIKGLCEKFRVHSQDDKARDLQELSSNFLSLPLFEQKTIDHSDTHYSVLRLLIELAANPTCTKPCETSREVPVEEDKDFDWAAYLREGEEVYTGYFSSSSEFSDDDEEDNIDNGGSDDIEESKNRENGEHLQVVEVALSKDVNMVETCEELQSQPSDNMSDWFQHNIKKPYWNGTTQDIPECSSYYNVVKFWESYMRNSYTFENYQTVTESQVIREIIWMLLGNTGTYIFQCSGTKYTLRHNITLNHLTPLALRNGVEMFLVAGSLMLQLVAFIDSLSERRSTGESDEVPLTYEAFAFSVNQFLHLYKSVLCKLEGDLRKQESTITILSVQKLLRPWIEKLTLVSNIYVNGVERFMSIENNSDRSASLLSCLYDTVIQLQLINHIDLLSVALPLWLTTSQPYTDIIDEWITTGQLHDSKKEFVIQRSEAPLTLDETFWKQSLVRLSKPNPDSDDDDCPVFNEVTYIIHDWTPRFLDAILEPIIKAGKSMLVFHTLNSSNTLLVKQRALKGQNCKSLFEMFLTNLNQYVDGELSSTQLELAPTDARKCIELDFPIQKMLDDQCNALLQINLNSLFKRHSPTSWQKFDVSEICTKLLSSCQFIHPMERMVEYCLYPTITDRYLWICKQLVQFIITDHALMEHLTAMRNFFLMEAGDTMFEFYSQIFNTIRDQWDSHMNAAFLNRALAQALEQNFPDEIGKLSVCVQKLPDPLNHDGEMQLSETNCINLAYSICWPVDMVLNSKSIIKYNVIFNMLLRIKHAKYSLDYLRFDDLEEADFNRGSNQEVLLNKEKIHRLHMLRIRLMYFTNTLNSHIMHQIAHSKELLGCLKTSVDLDEMVSCHESYLEHILESCFLDAKKSAMGNLLDQILSIGLQLSHQWRKGVNKISLETLAAMENNFSRWVPTLKMLFCFREHSGPALSIDNPINIFIGVV